MHPILHNGEGSPQDTGEVRTAPAHELGQEGSYGSNKWRYACSNGAAALTRGEVIVGAELVPNHQNLLTSTTSLVVGSNRVLSGTITLGATLMTANQYAEGWLFVVDGGAEGTYYRIRNHDAGSSGGTDFTLDLYDSITIASDANTEVSFVPNKYYGLQQSNIDNADVVVGVANVLVPVGSTTAQYFWAQVAGYCGVFVVGTPAVGAGLMVSDTTAGMLEERAETDLDPAVAEMVTVGITGEVQVVNLKIE
ncbi:MAG: hypothetical protein E4H28_04935 [Gemmatimonadales bacterium]|nr:MAG: hypothetical protein E4H28_04935 [Gemmatimonadales bacterium]